MINVKNGAGKATKSASSEVCAIQALHASAYASGRLVAEAVEALERVNHEAATALRPRIAAGDICPTIAIGWDSDNFTVRIEIPPAKDNAADTEPLKFEGEISFEEARHAAETYHAHLSFLTAEGKS